MLRREELRRDLAELRFSVRERRLFLIIFAAILVGKGIALLPLAFATDDISFVTRPEYNNPAVLDQGRFVLYWTRWLSVSLGVYATHATVLTGLLSFLAMAWAGVIICRIWKVSDDFVLATIVGLMFSLHPYTVGYFTFQVTVQTMFYEFFLTFLALHLARVNKLNLTLAALMMAAAIAKNQLVVNYAAVTIIFGLLLRLVATCRDRSVNFNKIVEMSRFVPRISALIVGTGIYFVLNGATAASGARALGRGQLLPMDAWGSRLRLVGKRAYAILFSPEPLLVPSVKMMLLGLLACALLVLLWCFLTPPPFRIGRRLGRTIAALGLLIGAGLSTFGVLILTSNWYGATRVMASMGLFFGGVVAVMLIGWHWGPFRCAVVIVSCLVLVGFIGANNRILTGQRITNLRDFHKANRILMTLEQKSGFSRVTTVAVIGRARYPDPVGTAIGDLSQSAFSRPWSRLAMLRAISGYDFAAPSPEQQRVAEDYCNGSGVWPEHDSITVMEELAVVCLGQ